MNAVRLRHKAFGISAIAATVALVIRAPPQIAEAQGQGARPAWKSSPTAVWSSASRLNVFVIGEDGNLWRFIKEGGEGWRRENCARPNGREFIAAPTAVRWEQGWVKVFACSIPRAAAASGTST